MREIKFKVLDYSGKTKIITLKDLNINNEFGDNSFDKFHGQYTGRKDKNGTEIYEGDVLKFKDYDINNKEEVKYVLGEIYWAEGHGGFAIKYPELKYARFTLDSISSCAEVIGNIYENSNLLEE